MPGSGGAAARLAGAEAGGLQGRRRFRWRAPLPRGVWLTGSVKCGCCGTRNSKEILDKVSQMIQDVADTKIAVADTKIAVARLEAGARSD
eukprot:219297-Rhodomonas_salina.1